MKKLLSLLLAVMMVISLCPITALADEVNPIELQQVEAQEEQQEEPIPEPSEEQTTEEQPEKPQQSEMNTLDLTGEAAPLAEGSANGGYYTESGAVIAFDENGISGCNYTVDKTPHTVATDTETTVSKTYIIRMREANFSFRNDGKDKATLYSANNNDPRFYFESGEQKPFENLSSFKQIELNRIAQNGTKYDLTNAKEVYFAYIQKIGDKNVGAAILIEIIPDSIKVNGSEFTAEKTELTGWNRIKSDGSTEKVECNNIYMTTLAYGDERLSLDFNGAVKYAGQALGSEKAEFSNISFTELFANSDYAVTGDNKAEGVSASTLFGEALPAGLSENDKVVFVAGYDAEDNAKAGIIIRIKNVQKISTVEEFVAFRDSVNAGATNIDVKLMADIDLSSVCGEGIGSWTPIEGFAGTFDGNGHTVSNLYVENNTDDAALFGTTAAGSIIKNLGVVSAKIIRTTKVSGLKSAILALTVNGDVDSCYTKDCNITVYGTRGSLFCDTNKGKISNCYVIGGAVTDLASGKFIKSFAMSNSVQTGMVSNCYAVKVTLKTDATITADTFLNTNKGLSNCYVLDSDNNTIKRVTVKDEAWFKSDEAIAALGGAWEKDTDNKNDGFPVLKSQKNSGSDKPTGKNNGIFTVQLEDGTEIYPQELHGAATIDPDNDGTNYKMDYVDGFWRVIVPEGTTAIKISLDNLKNTAGEKAEPYAFFALDTGGSQYTSGNADSYEFDPTFIKRDGKYCFYGNISYEGSEANIERQLETKYENGFYTIPLEDFASSAEYVQEDAEWYSYLSDFEGAKVNTDYKYASIFVGTFTKGKMANGYDCKILVQIGGVKEKPKNNGLFTVQLEDGTEVYPEKVTMPESIVWRDKTYPASVFDNYADAFWKVTVPASADALKFSLDNIKYVTGKENIEKYAFFATWSGNISSMWNSNGIISASFDYQECGPDGKLYGKVSLIDPSDGMDYSEYMYDTEYENGFYTIPFEYLMSDPADMGEVEKQVWGDLDPQYKYAVVYIGNFDDKIYTHFDAMVLVQIGGDGESGENTPPVRRSNVAASNLVSVDEKLQYTVDLSDVFYDADGDALTYKVRFGTDGEYVPFEGSTYTHTLTDWSGETLYFTANDGKTDGGSYIVKLNISRDVLIAICEAIIADPSDYWTENDRWDGTTYTGERYKHFVQQLDSYKRPNTSESYYKNALIEAYKKLMPKSKVNATCLYEEYSRVEDTSKYTDVSVSPYLEALAAVKALYAEGAIVNEPYTEEKQAEIDRVAAACREAREKLVLKTAYKKAFEYYQKNKDEAKKLLELYNPAKYNESDYTAESWQVFVSAWNDLKADVDFVFDEESGSAREYEMLNSFEAHMKALSQKFNMLVSAVDITVSFKYIENMHFRYEVKTAGTDGYYNAAMALKAGETTVMDAVNISGRTLYTFTSSLAQIKEGMFRSEAALDSKPLYALFVNDVYAATGHIGVDNADTNIGSYQLHNGDRVVLARITPQFIGYEASSGYDSTAWGFSASAKPEGIEKSAGLISITSVTQNAKVGDSVTIKVNAKTAYPSNLGKRLNAEGLTLMVSEPSEDNVISQNWQKIVFATSAMGTVDYVFTEPGYYTVAIVNNKYDEPTVTNVYGVTTVGTYNTLMIGDFTTVYIAPADDDEALIAEWREKNLAEAKAYFEQFKYYDFDNGYYEDTLVPMYKALVENQKNAKTFKELINSYNSDFAELQSTVNKNLRNHKAMVEELRGYLRYIPNDLSEMNYSYSSVVSAIQRIYGGMNDYEKNLLSDKERTLAEKIMLLDANNLPTGKKVAIDVQKDANIILMDGYGWLTSAPNENIVYKIFVGYGKSQKYYQWTTGGGAASSGNNNGAEPSDKDMTAYPGDRVHARRLVVTSDDAYWMVFSYDGGNTWNLSTKVDGGEGMFSADFTMPETDADTLVFALKMVSKAEYQEMKLNAETPEMALEEAQAAYKAALEEAFAAYDKDRYTAENYTTLRYAKEDGIANINKAKTVTAVVNYFNIALDAMKAVPQKAQVYVEVKNETFTESYVDDDGNTITPPWTGTLVAKWVNIDEGSTMMTCIVDALEGHTVMGAESNYISSIDGLGEFGGGSGSGWMGTLNDWFTNLGFGEFSVANGTLKAGDRISVLYTQTLGSDIGGAVEGNTDTGLKELSATNGTLAPAFDKETTSYLLTMDEGKHTVTLNYTANNKAFQVRTYLNRYTPSSDDYYACGETISVKEGDIIYVSCGDPAWPSMAGNDALKIIPHVYEITVVGSSGAVEKLIKALPAPEKLEYSDKGDVENAERLFDALGEDEQAKLDEQLKAKLRKCIERMAELERVNAVEELIAALPAKLPISDEEKVKVDEAKDAFDALGEELQKDVKSVYTNKLLSLLGQQKIYFDYQGGKENTKLLFTQKDGKLAVLPGTTKENYHFDGWYTEKDGGTQISLETIFTESCKLYAHWLNDVEYAEKLIDSIGEVTLESEEAIAAARAAYNALPIEQQELVGNYEVLTAAEAEYARLVKEAEDKAAAKAVDDLIAAIGEVKLTEECDAKIKAARKAFNALTPEQKAFVKNEKALTDAEAEYQKLFDQHKADKAAAKAVDEAVAKLAPVTLESGNAVKAARKAFDALTPEQKKLLDPKTEDKLVVAENEYKKLVKEDADKKAAKEVEDKIARLQPVTKDSGEAIKDARSSYEALTPEQKALVSKDSVAALDKAEKLYDMIIASTKPGTAVGDNTGSTSGSGVIKITANAAANGEQNPHTGAPVMSMAPAVLVLAAAALVLKKHK